MDLHPLVLAMFIALPIGTLNYLYWRKKGYKSFSQLILSFIAVYGLIVLILKLFVKQ